MDTLICTEVMESEVPLDAEEIGNGLGRLGDLWNRLQDLRPNRRLAVVNRDRKHARETRRHISVKAEKAGLEFVASIHNTTLYCRLERKEKTAA